MDQEASARSNLHGVTRSNRFHDFRGSTIALLRGELLLILQWILSNSAESGTGICLASTAARTARQEQNQLLNTNTSAPLGATLVIDLTHRLCGEHPIEVGQFFVH